MRARSSCFALLALCAACGKEPGAAVWFEESAAGRGLDFRWQSGHRERYYMPEIMGGGAALLDADGDGDLDAYLVQGGSLEPQGGPAPTDRLFANDGRARFADVTAASGLADPGYGMGAACGDADGDGDTDLYVTNVGHNALFLDQGGLRFADATAAAGVAGEGWSTSAGFFDYDRDGALDLFVTRYLEWSKEAELLCMDPLSRPDYCSPKNYKTPARDFLFRNGGGGRFEDVSRASGVWAEPGTGLGVSMGDLDGDGWLDVFVANDGMPNHLWKNGGAGRFENVAMLAGCGVDTNGLPKAGMGILLSDVDEDLDLDVLVCNLKGESDSFYRNEGGFFADRTAAVSLAAVSKPFTRFGVALSDFDHDGVLDLYEGNGRVERPTSAGGGDPYAEPNLLLRGRGDGTFEEVVPRGGTAELLVATSRAVAQGDLDGDGALDLLVVNRDGPAQLLLNRRSGRGSWILLRVLEKSGADALGATLTLELAGKRLRRDVGAAYGYLTSNDPRVHVGLGAVERVDGVLVRWVDGTTERFGPQEARGERVLRRGQGTPP
jgi:hypothetical protein